MQRQQVIQVYASFSNPWLLAVDSFISKEALLHYDNLTLLLKPRLNTRGVSALRVSQRNPSLLCVDNIHIVVLHAGARCYRRRRRDVY